MCDLVAFLLAKVADERPGEAKDRSKGLVEKNGGEETIFFRVFNFQRTYQSCWKHLSLDSLQE
jgi:hypothetical protein